MDASAGETKSWGRWATLGLGVFAATVSQLPALLACYWRYGPDLAHWPDLARDGVAVILLVCISTPVQVALLALLARRTGATATAYLGLTVPGKRDILLSLVVAVIVIAAGDGFSWLRGQDIITPFQKDIYRSAGAAGCLPWLWLTVVVMAPIGEEILFRGFLFRGWRRSPNDAWAAIGATALLWSIVHVQYDLFVLGQIFLVGLAFGWVRSATGSIVPTILMHALLNAMGMLETYLAFPGP